MVLTYVVRRTTNTEEIVSNQMDLKVEKTQDSVVGPARPTKTVKGLR